jgi:hypothetical protein
MVKVKTDIYNRTTITNTVTKITITTTNRCLKEPGYNLLETNLTRMVCLELSLDLEMVNGFKLKSNANHTNNLVITMDTLKG